MSTETNNVDVAPVDAAPAPPATAAAPAEATPSAAAPAPSAAAPAVAPKVQSYDEAFPGLGGGPAPTQAAVSWFNNPMKSIKSSTTSTTFQIPFEQRRFRPGAATEFGKGTAGDRGKAECLKIMNETKTNIEYSQRKDGSISVIISGKAPAVTEAKKQILANLTQQGSIDVDIPKEHHRFVLGKGAEVLKRIQDQTGAKISVPKADEKDGLIRVTGSKEAMDAAKRKIEQISAEQSGKHREVVEAEAWIHPFIRGGHDSNVDALKKKFGIVAIDVPPPSANKNDVVVRGKKEAAVACAAELKSFVAHKKKHCTTLEINVDQKQHRFVIGNKGKNIQDVLRDTGVSVEVPSQEKNSNVIVLRGEQTQMGAALTQVYANASSHQDAFVEAPEWMHRLLIGQKGATIREIQDKFGNDKVKIDFTVKDKVGIELEGTPAELDAVKSELERRIAEIKKTTSHTELIVPSQYHSHLIGKGGSNLTKLKEEFGVQVKIPQEADKSDKITIEGPPDGVKQAKIQLEVLAKKMADEASDFIVLNRRFHRQLIGSGGENIRKLRDQYPNVQISIPEEKAKSDQITLRGPSKELAAAVVQVKKIAKDLEEKGYRIEVPILKQYHRNIIGKAGAQIKKIREETNCQIELPKENTDSEIIAIIGRKADAEKARKMIRDIEKELVQISELEVKIETKLHQALIGAGGKRVKELQGEDAIIHFPSDGKSDVVTIRGKEAAVKAAKKALLEEAESLRLQSFSATVQAAPEYHRFLIGRGGNNMKEIRDSTGCRIAVPGANDDKQDIITILGTEAGVKKAKAILDKKVAELASIEEKEVVVPEQYHKNFTARRAELINKISSECGGVQISFPRPPKEGEEVSDAVKVKGPGNCVDQAIAMIKEHTDDFIAQVTEEIEIEKHFHGDIIGKGGKQVQELQNDFNVQIKFPSKDQEENVNIITISGRKEKIDEARAAIIALIPVTQEYPLDAMFHSDLIGQKGAGLQELTSQYNINIKVPQKPAEGEEPTNSITLIGKADIVETVVGVLDEKKKGWEADAEDRKLRNYTETIEVDPIFHSKIIGYKGEQINALRLEHDCRVNFPKDKDAEQITMIGYAEKVAAMKEAIMAIVASLEAHVFQDVLIAQKCHPRIIGSRGSGIRKIMKDYDVEIKIGRSPAQPDKVTVTGAHEKVEECIDYLLNLEEEILQELAEREDDDRYIPPSNKFNKEKNKKPSKNSQGYQVADAPWTLGADSFPTLGGQNGTSGAASSWGPKK